MPVPHAAPSPETGPSPGADPLPPVLPGVLGEAERLCGRACALALWQALAGQELRLRIDPPADHVLVRAIGLEAARRLGQHYGGTRVQVPTCGEWLRRSTKVQVLALADAGLAVSAIAWEAGTTVNYVREVLRLSRIPAAVARRRAPPASRAPR